MFHHHAHECHEEHGIPIEFTLRTWATTQDILGPKAKPGYLGIHMLDIHKFSQVDYGGAVAATLGTSDPELVDLMLMPWHLSDEIVATTLIVATTKGRLFVTEIRANGGYTTFRVEYQASDEAFDFVEPEVDMHPWSWERMELLKLAPRGAIPFDMAIASVAAMMDTASEGIHIEGAIPIDIEKEGEANG